MRKAPAPNALTASEHQAAILRANRRVTSYDVALVAGVSQSAVSRCFKPGASVAPATYARVMKAAAGLDYIPNAAARSLITRRSNMVAVIICDKTNLYHPEALSELSRHITNTGKRVLLFTLSREAEVDQALSDVWRYQIDGVIAGAALTGQHVAEFERRRVPLVLFNRAAPGQQASSIRCDPREAGRMLVSRLAPAGHRQFGIIDGKNDTTVVRERLLGAREQLAELGLPAPLVVHGDHDYGSGARGLRALIAQQGRVPDAVLCGNDVMALGCLDCARHELGLSVPGQLSVAGFDAVEPSGWLSYKLTTLRQPIPQMALAAASLLAARIERPDAPPEQRLFGAQLIEGATARLHPLRKPSLVA